MPTCFFESPRIVEAFQFLPEGLRIPSAFNPRAIVAAEAPEEKFLVDALDDLGLCRDDLIDSSYRLTIWLLLIDGSIAIRFSARRLTGQGRGLHASQRLGPEVVQKDAAQKRSRAQMRGGDQAVIGRPQFDVAALKLLAEPSDILGVARNAVERFRDHDIDRVTSNEIEKHHETRPITPIPRNFGVGGNIDNCSAQAFHDPARCGYLVVR